MEQSYLEETKTTGHIRDYIGEGLSTMLTQDIVVSLTKMYIDRKKNLLRGDFLLRYGLAEGGGSFAAGGRKESRHWIRKSWELSKQGGRGASSGEGGAGDKVPPRRRLGG